MSKGEVHSAPDLSPHGSETDMMEQYRQVKAQYQDALLFFRFGDFYEMFYDDAAVASRELEIMLTSRPQGKGGERVPMCGVPHHRLDVYLARLVEKGYKVAICEQLEGPQKGRSIIRRDVVRIVTPGTLFESGEKERTLAALFSDQDLVGVAFLELTTGEFRMAETTWTDLPSLLVKFQPNEILLRAEETYDHTWSPGAYVTHRPGEDFAVAPARKLLAHTFGRGPIDAFALSHRHALVAAGVLLSYVRETQRDFLPHLTPPQPYQREEFVFLDPQTQRNLELVENIFEGTQEGTLLSVLDDAQTRMGRRRLRSWLLHPLRSVEQIRQRHEVVAAFVSQHGRRAEVRTTLSRILDLERLTSRITSAVANPRDLATLGASLVFLPQLRTLFLPTDVSLLCILHDELDTLEDVRTEIQRVLVEEPKAQAKEGGVIRHGVCAELDELRTVQTDGSGWLARYEQQERERTGIPNLKVGFNRVFGYYLEVTKSFLSVVPEAYIRRQTLVNAERFITKDLQRFEDRMLSAADRSKLLEYELFTRLREYVAAQAARLRRTAAVLGRLDALAALAEVAAKKGWVRPEVCEEYAVGVSEGRHPMVEERSTPFVPNDLSLDETTHLLILTGPNAAGKSTYARQIALVVLLAQMGSFVPAKTARIGVVDRIFTRVGATDFLAHGLSTFMVEMMETANILRHATRKSLIILDEVGRGTGTSDGKAIAQAVAEVLARDIKAKTLFTTHYHELARLAGEMPGVANARLEVREEQDEVTFLYKVVPGAAQKSYGLYVARLAGLPSHVLQRARALLTQWQEEHGVAAQDSMAETQEHSVPGWQADDRQAHEPASQTVQAVMDRLAHVDPLHTTPLEALVLLAELKRVAEGKRET